MFYVTGDIHGITERFRGRLADIPLSEGDILLCLGDVGLKYGSFVNGELRRAMAQLPCRVLVMRGNHDTRYCRDLQAREYGPRIDRLSSERHFSASGRRLIHEDFCGIEMLVDTKYPNIGYLPDGGGMFTRNGMNCLVAPGAFSVDGDWRKATGREFEHEELLTGDEAEELAKGAMTNRIDFVFSHTAPLTWQDEFSDMFLGFVDQSRVDASMEFFFNEVWDCVHASCKGWYFGHYHGQRDVADGVGHMLFQNVVAIEELA